MKVTETQKLDVRPHPHIGLSTVTYLFEGQGFHRDSLGSSQVIRPGELNWMTAGKGIVHSERTPQEVLDSQKDEQIHGIQIWVGLPKEFEKIDPSFNHYKSQDLPDWSVCQGLQGKILIGEHDGIKSPVKTYSQMFFSELRCTQNIETKLSLHEKELALYIAEGSAEINANPLGLDDLIIVADPKNIDLKVSAGSKLVIIGGTPFPEERTIWWNLVASNKEDIYFAAKLWEQQKLGQVPGETEFIPLPSDPLP
jgi:redox-sensitive bicupin YhaK (pirin superfamily)